MAQTSFNNLTKNKDLSSIYNKITLKNIFPPRKLSGWKYCKKITISKDLIDADLTDFPVTVYLNNKNLDFNKCLPNHADIRFTDKELNQLKYEKVEYSSNTELLLKFDDNLIDYSINNIVPTTLSGTPSINTSTYKFGSASFNATAGSSSMYYPLKNQGFLNNNFTVEFWAYPTALVDGGNFLYISGGTEGYGFLVHSIGTTGVGVWAGVQGSSWNLLSSWNTGFTRTLNTWVHWALVHRDGMLYAYENGVLKNFTTLANMGTYSGTLNLYVNGRPGYVTQYFGGYLDEIRLSGVAEYAHNFTPQTSSYDVDKNLIYNVLLPTIYDKEDTEFYMWHGVENTTQYSAVFDGSGDYFFSSGNNIMNFSSSNWTVEGIVKFNAMPTSDAWPTSWSLHQVLIGVGGVGLADGIDCIIGQTKLMIQNNDTQYAGTAHGMTVGNIYHIAYVRNGNAIYFYVNGVQKGSVAFSISVGTGANTYIGCETGEGAYFNGNIYGIRVTNGLARYTTDFIAPSSFSVDNASVSFCTNFENINGVLPGTDLTGKRITPYGNTYLKRDIISDVYNQSIEAWQDQTGKLLTYNGAIKLPKLGGYAYFDGSGDYLTTPDSEDFNFADGDFCIEALFKYTSLPASGVWNGLYSHRYDSNNNSAIGMYVYNNAGTYKFYTEYTTNGTTAVVNQFTITLNTTSINHFAMCRQGSIITCYHNGTSVGTISIGTGVIYNSTAILTLMGYQNSGAFTANFTGYAYGIRVTKGSARYTTTFTPPTNFNYDSSNVKLCITFQEPIGTTKFTDLTGKAITTVGNVNEQGYITSGNRYAYFNGSSSYLTMTNSSDFTFGTNNFTIEWWEYKITNTGAQAVLHQHSGTSDLGFLIGYDGTLCYMTGNNSSWDLVNAFRYGNNALTNQWVHRALVRNGNILYGYENGTLYAQVALTGTPYYNASYPIYIGRYQYSTAGHMTGYLRGMRITKGVARYTSTFTPPSIFIIDSSNVIFNTNFDTIYNGDYALVNHMGYGSLNDASGYGEVLTNSATTKVASEYGDATYFNGGSYLRRSTSTFNKSNGQEITITALLNNQWTTGYANMIVNRSSSNYNWMLYLHTTNGTIQMHGSAQNQSSNRLQSDMWEVVTSKVSSGAYNYIFIDDRLVQTVASYSYAANATSELSIGNYASNEYWRGEIKELRISFNARSDAWIKAEVYSIKNNLLSITDLIK